MASRAFFGESLRPPNERIQASNSSTVAALASKSGGKIRSSGSVLEIFCNDVFMIFLEVSYCEFKSLFWNKRILPNLLEQSRLVPKHILVGNTMRTVETAHVGPYTVKKMHQDHREGCISSPFGAAKNEDLCFPG